MSAAAALLRRAGALFVEPPAREPAPDMPLDVVVTGLSKGAGATTVAHGLALALRRLRPVELAGPGQSGAVTAGPGMALIRAVPAEELHPRRHRGVLVAVADARREPALAALVAEALAERHEGIVLVGNRARDVAAWEAHGALCVPDAVLGAWLLTRGARPPGAMGAALDSIANRLVRGCLPPPGIAQIRHPYP